MKFMFINQNETMYIRIKYLKELLLEMWKELKIFTLSSQFFSFTSEFDYSGGIEMKFAASRHREFINLGKEENVNICTKIFGKY